MLDVFLVLLSKALYAGANVLDALIAGKMFKKLSTVVFYSGMIGFLGIPVTLAFGMPKGLPFNFDVLFCLSLIVFIEVFYQFPYYKILKEVDTSIVTAMFSLGKITMPILAYFLVGEKLSVIQYLSFFVIIFANIALNYDFSKRLKEEKSEKAKKNLSSTTIFFWMLFISILFSLLSVLTKRVLFHLDWITLRFWSSLFTFLLSFLIIFLPSAKQDIRNSFPIFRKNFKVFFSMEFLTQLGGVCSIVALTTMPVVVLTSIGSTQPIFVLLLGIILNKFFGDKFKEQTGRREVLKKLICFLIILIGIILSVMELK